MIAEALTLEGEAEAKMLKGFVQKRNHEEQLRQIEAFDSFSDNKNSVIFG